MQNGAALHRNCQVEAVNGDVVKHRRLACQAFGGEPCRLSRQVNIEVDHLGFRFSSDKRHTLHERRNGRHFILDRAYLRRQHNVDLIEVGLEVRELIARAYLRRSDSQVEIDVRVHACQQMLQDKAGVVSAGVEGDLPAAAELAVGLVSR